MADIDPRNIRFIPRERDDQLLMWLEATAAGVPCKKIAAIHGTTPQTVQITLKKIRDADVAESGEPAGRVIAAYGKGTKPRRQP